MQGQGHLTRIPYEGFDAMTVKIHTTLPPGPALTPVASVKPGTRLIADGSFSCLAEGEEVQVRGFGPFGLCVPCCGHLAFDICTPNTPKASFHWISPQIDVAGENYIGFWLVEDSLEAS